MPCQVRCREPELLCVERLSIHRVGRQSTAARIAVHDLLKLGGEFSGSRRIASARARVWRRGVGQGCSEGSWCAR
jgi:hypothetical protein